MQALLDATHQWPLLTAAEEGDLARRIEAGRAAAAAVEAGADDPALVAVVADGQAAKHRFLMCNIRLVVSFARRVPPPPGMDIDDLVQEGIVGLDHAIDKFDWQRGYKFSTYASWWIRQAISRALDERGTLIRIPTDRASRLRANLRQFDGDAGLLEPDHARAYWLSHPTSLDQSVGGEDGAALIDFQADGIDPADEVVAAHTLAELGQALDRLGDVERQAVSLRFGLDGSGRRTYNDIGAVLDIAAENARRLVRRALRRLGDDLSPRLA